MSTDTSSKQCSILADTSGYNVAVTIKDGDKDTSGYNLYPGYMYQV